MSRTREYAEAIEFRQVTRWFWGGRGFASLGALCRFIAKREIGQQIRDSIEFHGLTPGPGKDVVSQALVLRYELTWEPVYMDYDRPSQDTRELWQLEIRERAKQIRAEYEWVKALNAGDFATRFLETMRRGSKESTDG